MEADFIQFISAHPRIIQKVCRLYGRDEEGWKDLYQEIVLQLWRAFPTYRRESQISTWMYRIALNTAISLYRHEGRRIAPVKLEDNFLTEPQSPATSEPDERIEQFYAAVDHLSPIEKALVFLYVDDNSYEEIARIMGISPSNVGVKLNRIKGKLKRIVALTNQ
ncbi:RNA polymerase sigma factor [Spirosoma sp. BT702]|uniref:RNA polymerase sigma factor n=1 Tax=Spirosoma profusum TaxID=2771354 RepID=A0A926XTV8_9BACT|nr:RNA polymerase sigma factor [Spirosoma profusum]MBD2700268.1 RNA polymerase sigma factor [Spirosoma profusum]